MYEIVAWSYKIVNELLCHWIFNCTIEWRVIWEWQNVSDSCMILQDSRWATLSLNIRLYDWMQRAKMRHKEQQNV